MTGVQRLTSANEADDLLHDAHRGVVSAERPRPDAKDSPPCPTPRPAHAEGQRPPLTLPEAAGYLNVTERYMRRLVAERRIPFFKVGRLLRFSVGDLDAFFEACRVEPPPVHPLLAPRRRTATR
jgi:excisionase family DNA binding protein